MQIIDNEYDRSDFERRKLVGRMKLVRITPKMASKYLEKNGINRPLNETHVERFVEIIKSGLWCPVSCVFHIADNGTLLNGQHRLNAIVRSEITVYAWVCFDISETTYNAIDTEMRKRAIADLLPRGTLCKNNIGAICNALWNIKYNEWPSLSQKTLDLFYEYQPDIEWAWSVFQPKVSIFSAGVIGAFAYAHSVGKIQKKVEAFAEELVTGIGRETGALSIVLERACMRTSKMGNKNRRIIQRKTLRAIQFYCEGRRAEKLQETLEGVNFIRSFRDEAPLKEEIMEDAA